MEKNKDGSDKKQMGRPPLPFDWEVLDKILKFKPSLKDTASVMNCSIDLVEQKIKEKYKITFSEYREQKMASVRLSLVQKAIGMAESGDRVMLIFCLKNLLNWSDNPKELIDIKDKIDKLVIDLGSLSNVSNTL